MSRLVHLRRLLNAFSPIDLDALKTGNGRYTETAAADNGSDLSARLDAMYEVVTKYLPRLANRQIVLDSGTLVGELSDGMNRTLGRSFL